MLQDLNSTEKVVKDEENEKENEVVVESLKEQEKSNNEDDNVTQNIKSHENIESNSQSVLAIAVNEVVKFYENDEEEEGKCKKLENVEAPVEESVEIVKQNSSLDSPIPTPDSLQSNKSNNNDNCNKNNEVNEEGINQNVVEVINIP